MLEVAGLEEFGIMAGLDKATVVKLQGSAFHIITDSMKSGSLSDTRACSKVAEKEPLVRSS